MKFILKDFYGSRLFRKYYFNLTALLVFNIVNAHSEADILYMKIIILLIQFLCTAHANMESRCHQNCVVPCVRSTYIPSLSNSQLSHTNIERTVLKRANRRQVIRDKFHRASETFQQVDSQASELNKQLVSKFLTSADDLLEQTGWADQVFTTDSLLADLACSADMVNSGAFMFVDDLTVIRNAIQKYQNLLNAEFDFPNLWQDFDSTQSARKDLFTRYRDNANKTKLYQDWCTAYRGNKGEFVFGDLMDVNRQLPDIEKKYLQYIDRLVNLFGNDSLAVVQDFDKHIHCMKIFSIYNDTLLVYPDQSVKNKCNEKKDFSNQVDLDEMTSYLEPFFRELAQQFPNNDWDIWLNDKSFEANCNWFPKASDENQVDYKNIESLAQCQEHDLTILSEQLGTIKDDIDIIRSRLTNQLDFFINQTKVYQSQGITKLELAESVSLISVVDMVQDLKVHLRDVKDESDNLMQRTSHFTNEWAHILKIIAALTFPPLLTSSQIRSLHLMNEVS